ncbi:Hypothetical predicted protein [Xyrichtys novacula]|uniref:Uncharacterized protein n=1 Tax=Xyrichtys novacula TaxID=13765 RepID=A0AAV1HKM2_XYRNO|nr:Hypothetical predicted protein [Xyrichtys novacula]
MDVAHQQSLHLFSLQATLQDTLPWKPHSPKNSSRPPSTTAPNQDSTWTEVITRTRKTNNTIPWNHAGPTSSSTPSNPLLRSEILAGSGTDHSNDASTVRLALSNRFEALMHPPKPDSTSPNQSPLRGDVVASSTAAAGAPMAPTRPPGEAPRTFVLVHRCLHGVPAGRSSGDQLPGVTGRWCEEHLPAGVQRDSRVAWRKGPLSVGAWSCSVSAWTTALRAGPRPRPPTGVLFERQSDGTPPGPPPPPRTEMADHPRCRRRPPHRRVLAARPSALLRVQEPCNPRRCSHPPP